MAITIKGIRIEDISIARDTESGGYKISSANYSLLSSVDKVLAKQSIGGYGAITLEASPATVKLLQDFSESYRKDVVTTLGLEE